MASDQLLQTHGAAPPAPHRRRISIAALFSALLAAPLAWSAQLLVNYGLASHACFAKETPSHFFRRGWEWVGSATIAVNLACLAIAITAIIASLSIWRRTREEAPGGHESALDIGQGRTRFLAIWGVWSGVWFALQILFATVAIFWVPPCGS
jgi:hypothetical protein